MNGLVQTRHLRALAGNADARIENLHECVRGLSAIIGAWRSLPAQSRAIEGAIVQADAVARGLRELRAGGKPDAA